MTRSFARRLATCLLAPSIVAGGFLFAAAPAAHAEPPTIADLVPPGEAVLESHDERSFAPGMTLSEFARLEAGGWTTGSVLTVDLDTDVFADYQYSGTVTEPQTVRAGAERRGARAAINGDFFDINNSFAPLGVGVSRDEGLITSPVPGREKGVVFGPDGAAGLAEVFVTGTVSVEGGGEFDLDAVNTHAVAKDGIGLYTSGWGEYPRSTVVGSATDVVEVVLDGGVVATITDTLGAGELPDGTVALVGREAGAIDLRTLHVGDEVDVTYAPTSEFGEVTAAVGGNHYLVEDGVANPSGDQALHPRSAIGFDADHDTMYLVVIEGRMADATGMSLPDLAEFMVDIGAHEALNIDGGGSSTLVVQEPAREDHAVVNRPTDGFERSVANGLSLFTGDGSGELAGFRVEPVADDAPATLERSEAADDAVRVFRGLSRTLQAWGHDDSLNPVEATPRWSSEASSIARVPARPGDQAVVTGGPRLGTTEITAGDLGGGPSGAITVRSLGRLAHIEPSSSRLSIADATGSGQITVHGYDAAGNKALIEGGDITVAGDDDVVEVTATPDGLTVAPLVDSGSAGLTLDVGGVTSHVAVTIGTEDLVVADFADATDWTISFARATGAIAPAPGPDGRNAIHLSYDFTGPNTRAAYAAPPQSFTFPGQPQTVTAWVKGDGHDTWMRMRLYDANGTLVTLSGEYTPSTQWQLVEYPVPAGTAYPLTFRDIYAVEPDGNARYHGHVTYSDIAVQVAPDVEMPAAKPYADGVLLTDGTVNEAPQRIAVMSDAQFVARDPGSGAAEGARRTLREIVAAQPAALVINGDLVDEASPADFDFARLLLTEELADVSFPWYYVPGNHEIQGGDPADPIGNFVDEFGDTNHEFQLAGTRFVTLNTAYGSLRNGGFDQIVDLRDELDAAGSDPEVTGLVVFGHHPPDDPAPTKLSQLGDRLEAAMLRSWLGKFRADTGKGAAFVGAHAGVFHASSLDGVPFLINGNSGKSPAGAPGDGGFTGWTMLGIDPGGTPGTGTSRDDHAGGTWFAAEVRARVDDVSLDPPSNLPVGETVSAGGTIDQDDGRIVPLGWPIAAQWSGVGLWAGAIDEAPDRAVVAIDPVTGALTGLRAGTVEVSVTVNGVTASSSVTVTD